MCFEGCPHDDFEVIYYGHGRMDGVMLRKCKNCGQIGLRSDRAWCDIAVIWEALESVDKEEYMRLRAEWFSPYEAGTQL